MANFLIKRFFTALLLIWLMSVIMFSIFITSTSGLDRVFVFDSSSPFDIARQRSTYEIDQSTAQQYFVWMGQIFRGNFGMTVSSDGPGFSIGVLLLPKIRASLILMISALLFAVITGLTLGIISAMFSNTKISSVINIFVMSGVSIPDFAVGILLIVVFAVNLRLLPPSGASSFLEDPTFKDIFWDRFRHLILPVVTLSFAYIATFTEHVRINLLEVMREDYIRTARSKGLTELKILLKHCLRNGIIPIMATLFASIPFFLGGIVVVEYLFSYPGIGLYLFENLTAFRGDFYIGLIIIGMASFAALMASFFADFLYVLIDPRIKVPTNKSYHHSGKLTSTLIYCGLGIFAVMAYFLFLSHALTSIDNLPPLFLVIVFCLIALSVQRKDLMKRDDPKRFKQIRKASSIDSGTSFSESAYYWKRSIKKLIRPSTIFCFIVVLLIVVGSFYPQIMGYHDPSSLPGNFSNRLEPPSKEHILGTNSRGQDMLLFILTLTQDTLKVVFFATSIAVLAGLILGILSGYFRGLPDKIVMTIFDLLASVPSYFLVLLLMGLFDTSMTRIVFIISIFGVIDLGRVVRARVLTVSEFQFIQAAKAIGNTDFQIIINYLLKNILPLIWGQSIILFGKNMLLLSSLGYLRVLPFLSWGSVAGEAVRRSLYSWWTSVVPIFFIFVIVMSVNVLGKGVLRALDPFAEKQS